MDDDDDDDDILFDVDISAAHGQAANPAAQPAPHQSLQQPMQGHVQQGHQTAHGHAQLGSFGASASHLGAVDPTGGPHQQQHPQQQQPQYQQHQPQPQQYQPQQQQYQQQNHHQQPWRPTNQAAPGGRRRSTAVGQLSLAPTHAATTKPISPSGGSVQHLQQVHTHHPSATGAPNSLPDQQAHQYHPPHPQQLQNAQQSAYQQPQHVQHSSHLQPQAPQKPQLHLTASQHVAHTSDALPSQQLHAAPETAAYSNISAMLPFTSASETAVTATHAPHACSDSAGPKQMKTMLHEMTRLANENTALKDQVKQHAPAAPSVLADNASLRATVEHLRKQLQVKDHELSKQHERLQEQKHAAMEAKQHAESLGAMNAQLHADSAAPMGDMHGGAQTLAHPTAPPHRSQATFSSQYAAPQPGSSTRWPKLNSRRPQQRQSLAQVLLMHAPYSVGILTPPHTQHACTTEPDSALQEVSCTVGVILRAALTGSATSHAVLEQLVATLPAAVSAASKTAHRSAGEPGSNAVSSLHSDEGVREGKKRLGALWLVLATVLRCCAAEHSAKGASQTHADSELYADLGAAIKPIEPCDTVSAELKRLALLTGSSGIAAESLENCPQGANGGGAGHTQSDGGNVVPPQKQQGLGVSAAVAVKWLQAQTEGGGSVVDVCGTHHSSKIGAVATQVMQPLCETLRIATHETHALETLFSVLMFVEV